MYTCPVCEWPKLREDPHEGMHEICPQCGLQFGYGDAGPEGPEVRWKALRERWLAAGRLWHSKVVPKPNLQTLVTEYNRKSNELYALKQLIQNLRGDNPPVCFGEDDCSTATLVRCPWSMDCGK